MFFLTNYLRALTSYDQKGLDATQLERKIRLLALADLGFQNIGQDLPYAQVATSLQVPATQVERWVIDGKSPRLRKRAPHLHLRRS